MEIILLENILNLGKIGEKVNVKNGYGRNFLLKTGKALRFSKENQEIVNKKKDELIKKNLSAKKEFENISALVNKKTFTFYQESKEKMENCMVLLNLNRLQISSRKKQILLYRHLKLFLKMNLTR